MKILHYFLGFPPYRSGGLTKFCTDLIYDQAKCGDQVYALWPGRMRLFSKSVQINTKIFSAGVYSCEMINPLPVPLDEGIQDTQRFMQQCDVKVFLSFLNQIKPDVIHIHTLMGLYKEFVEAAATLHIKTIFTTHDYFGICPIVTLFNRGVPCDNDNLCADCISCCKNALSLKKIMILQSVLYRALKDTILIKKMRKSHRNQHFLENENLNAEQETNSASKSNSRNYQKLRAYYMDMLRSMTLIHCNSLLAKQIYERYLPDANYRVLTISNKGIRDQRHSTHHSEHVLRIAYLAPAKPFKGYLILRQALDEIWKEGHKDFQLRVFSPISEPEPYMAVREEGFRHEELASIMLETDVLIAPSVWYETFGFTVLEALSFGVPVIVSEHVGAKDIVADGGIVVKAGSVEQLKSAIVSLSHERLKELREHIRQHVPIKTWDMFLHEYNKLLISLFSNKENTSDY